jgi:pimeloyl-ACP methyl ester carboxylesterase
MKNQESKKRSRAAKFGIIAGLLILVLAICYPIADWMREPMNDTARKELLQEGKAKEFVKTSLGTMHVRVSGPVDGPVVLLVHGGVVGGYVFEKWQKPLADAGYRVIVPDLLGQGYSDHPNIPYTKEFYVSQLKELLDGLKITKNINLVGASLGGGISIAFAGAYPQRILSLNLIAPEGGGKEGKVINRMLLIPVVGDWVFRVLGPTVLQQRMSEANKDNPVGQQGMMNWMKEQSRYRGYPDGILNTVRCSFADHGITRQPEALKVIGKSGIPVIAVWGTKDIIVPFVYSQTFKSNIPQLELVPIKDQGHAINFGKEANVISFILPFLDKINKPKENK